MKPSSRKLTLKTETLRNLSRAELGKVAGGVSSGKATWCSTWEDTGCVNTGASTCDSHIAECASNACISGFC